MGHKSRRCHVHRCAGRIPNARLSMARQARSVVLFPLKRTYMYMYTVRYAHPHPPTPIRPTHPDWQSLPVDTCSRDAGADPGISDWGGRQQCSRARKACEFFLPTFISSFRIALVAFQPSSKTPAEH